MITKVKITQRAIAILSVILACVVGGGLLVLPAENAQAQAPIPKSNLSSAIPINPNIVSNPETNFGDFAWKTFVALNWPADCTGSALKEKTIGEAPDAPRVWEFYQFPEDVFLPDGMKPNLPLVVPPQCPGSGDNQSVDENLRFTEFASEATLHPDQLRLNPNLQLLVPGQKPLVDRAGNYVLNEVRMNPVEVNQIVENGWYSAKNLNQFNNTHNLFQLMCSAKEPNGTYPQDPPYNRVPCSDNDSVGTIELKASWTVLPDSKKLPDGSDATDKYYITKRTLDVNTPEGNQEETTFPVALVGFHIIQKTSQQGWVWATFEHINNLPDDNNVGEYYNLFSLDCKENCDPNIPYVKEPYLWNTKEFPHAVTKTETDPSKKQIPSQITRLVPIPDIAKSLNSTWQTELATEVPNSVWQNYQLIGVQWLQNPYVPYQTGIGGREVIPEQLVNVTLEPYVQKGSPGNSCIACHSLAKLPPLPKDLKNRKARIHADFSFLLENSK